MGTKGWEMHSSLGRKELNLHRAGSLVGVSANCLDIEDVGNSLRVSEGGCLGVE